MRVLPHKCIQPILLKDLPRNDRRLHGLVRNFIEPGAALLEPIISVTKLASIDGLKASRE